MHRHGFISLKLHNVLHMWNLDSLLSHPRSSSDRCCQRRRSDRLFSSSSNVPEVVSTSSDLVLPSHVAHDETRALVFSCLIVETDGPDCGRHIARL